MFILPVLGVGGGVMVISATHAGTWRVMVGGYFFVWGGTFCFSGNRLHCVYSFDYISGGHSNFICIRNYDA